MNLPDQIAKEASEYAKATDGHFENATRWSEVIEIFLAGSSRTLALLAQGEGVYPKVAVVGFVDGTFEAMPLENGRAIPPSEVYIHEGEHQASQAKLLAEVARLREALEKIARAATEEKP